MSDEQAAWSDEIVYLAEMFHDIYEIEATRFGWKSQTPVPFYELPEANKQTMLCTVARVRGQMLASLRSNPPQQGDSAKLREIEELIRPLVGQLMPSSHLAERISAIISSLAPEEGE
jgi:hypothetical protein